MLPAGTAGEARLIPAWAGKTTETANGHRAGEAHPRVGGENVEGLAVSATVVGSSPRGRGKLKRDAPHTKTNRLIPAWAGKTLVHKDRSD